jgi:hypothetical protein
MEGSVTQAFDFRFELLFIFCKMKVELPKTGFSETTTELAENPTLRAQRITSG